MRDVAGPGGDVGREGGMGDGRWEDVAGPGGGVGREGGRW